MVLAADPATRTLVVGSEQDYPPFALGRTDAEADGFTVELWKEVAKEAELKYTIRVMPFHHVLQEFKKGKIDVLINLAQSDERRQFVDFSIPHVTINGAIFVRKGESGIRSEADLAGKSIIVLNADLAHDYAVSRGWGKQLVLADTAADGFRLLASGKYDAMLIAKLTGLQTLHALNISNITALDVKPGFSQKFSFAVHKGDADLLARINEGLALTKPNGTFDALHDKWFGPYEEKPVTFLDVFRYLAPIALLLLGFAGYEVYKRKVEHLQSENALKSSEARLRAMIEALPIPVTLNNQHGEITYLNPAFVAVFGYTHAEIPTLADWWPRAYPDAAYREWVADTWAQRIERSKRDSQAFEPLEVAIRAKDGSTRVVLASAASLFGNFDDEHMVALIDITPSKQAEMSLRLSEERFDLAMRAANDGLWDWNMQTDAIYFSPRWKSMLGYADSELENSFAAWEQLSHDEDRARILAMIEDCVAGRAEGFSAELRMRHQDGHWVDILSRATLIRDQDGKAIRMVGTHVDISDHKRIQRNLTEARQGAEAATKAKADFLACMSHEIRTPMNGIIGLTQLALNQKMHPELQDFLEKIYQSSQSLMGILNDILDFSKLEAGQVSIESIPFELGAVLDNLRFLFEETAALKALELHLEIAEGVPNELVGDALRLQQVLSNLISNALKFTERGQVSLFIAPVEITPSKATIAFAVEDTGIGMSEQVKSKLFQEFTQADSSITRRFGGTGLGLVISRNLLQLMGGDFSVESTVNRGSRFSFALTFALPATKKTRRTGQRVKQVPGDLRRNLEILAAPLRGTTILVVEDNAINQKVVCEFLKVSGIRTVVANNGEEALMLLEHEHFDAILMDLHMPVMGGAEATEHIRGNPRYRDLPIIALTAGVMEDERERCFAAGMNDFVAKPINPQQLMQVLATWVQGSAPAEPPPAEPPPAEPAAVTAEDPLSEPRLAGFDLASPLFLLGGDQSMLGELLRGFKQDMAGVPEQIREKAEAGDLNAAREIAHKIKGSAGNVGAMDLHKIAQQLEKELKEGSYHPATLQKFSDQFRISMDEIDKLA